MWSQQSYYLDSKEKEHEKEIGSNLKESYQVCVLCQIKLEDSLTR